MNDPHSDDFCVVCLDVPRADGPSMHPVGSIENGCVCQDCVEDVLPAVAKGNRSSFDKSPKHAHDHSRGAELRE